MLDLLFYTGLRASELINIRHRDYQDNSLRIHGKGNKVRYAFIPDFLAKHFKPSTPGYLFISEGKRIEAPQVRKIIQKRVKLAKINK